MLFDSLPRGVSSDIAPPSTGGRAKKKSQRSSVAREDKKLFGQLTRGAAYDIAPSIRETKKSTQGVTRQMRPFNDTPSEELSTCTTNSSATSRSPRSTPASLAKTRSSSANLLEVPPTIVCHHR